MRETERRKRARIERPPRNQPFTRHISPVYLRFTVFRPVSHTSRAPPLLILFTERSDVRRVSRRKRGETQPSGGSEGDGRMKVRRSPSTSVTRRSYRESSPFPPLSVIYPLLSSGRRSSRSLHSLPPVVPFGHRLISQVLRPTSLPLPAHSLRSFTYSINE